MSGILDNRSRVLDALITYEGRRQLVDGKFDVKYVSFTDRHVVYETDAEEGHVDPSKKIYLEAYNAPYDQITFEADDSGKLKPFRQHATIGLLTVTGSVTSSASWKSFVNGNLISRLAIFADYSSVIQGSTTNEFINGSQFASQLEGILQNSIDNFKSLGILGSSDNIFEDQEFATSLNSMEFVVNKNTETIQMQLPTNINTIDALFSDEKLRNAENFMYLPPIRKINFDGVDRRNITALANAGLLLGKYPAWGPIEKLTFAQISNELQKYEKGNLRTVYFDPTSRDNELVGQFFEVTNNTVKKLDVIDYGKVNNNFSNPKAVTNHVFFIGKVLTDDTGTDNFVHIFTLVFGPMGEDEV
jgi:hypothetical protein